MSVGLALEENGNLTIGKKTLVSLLKQGFSTRKVAAELHSSQTTIRHWLRKYGLQTTRKSSFCCHFCGEIRSSRMMNKGNNRNSYRYWGLEKAKAELDKCLLVC